MDVVLPRFSRSVGSGVSSGGGVATMRVVPSFDVAEDGEPDLGVRGEAVLCEERDRIIIRQCDAAIGRPRIGSGQTAKSSRRPSST